MIEKTLGELLEEKVTLDIEGIDRLYLNAYQPMLQTGGGVSAFFRHHRGAVVASTTLMAPMSQDFVVAQFFENQTSLASYYTLISPQLYDMYHGIYHCIKKWA